MQPKKIYRIFFTAIIIFFTPFISKAQIMCKDTIHLKNGQVVYGRIMDNQKPLYVVIKVNDTVAYMYSWYQVKSVYNCFDQNSYPYHIIDMSGVKRSKFFISIEAEESLLFSKMDTNTVSFVTIPRVAIGYNFEHEFSCGLGAGYFAYNHSDFTPLYVVFKKYFFDESLVEPYLEGDMGYTLCNPTIDNKGGINVNLRLGLKTPFVRRLELFGTFGLGYQQFTYYQSGESDIETGKESGMLTINLNIGLLLE